MSQFLTCSNLLSLSRIAIAPFAVTLILHGQANALLALCLFTIAGITDFLDGYVARRCNTVTSIGAFIDPLADKILILSLLGAFYWIGTIKLWMVLLIALRDVIVMLLRIIAINQNRIFVTSKLAKGKTTIQFLGIYVLFLSLHTNLAPSTDLFIPIIMYAIVGFTIWTGVSYSKNFLS